MEVFELTTGHIRLLRSATVRWWDAETGAPCINPKRPYGNSGIAAVQDVARILGWDCPDPDEDEDAFDRMADRAMAVHRETETALQIVLQTGEFKPGEYVSDKWGNEWQPRLHDSVAVKDPPEICSVVGCGRRAEFKIADTAAHSGADAYACHHHLTDMVAHHESVPERARNGMFVVTALSA